ncbi:MAG: hypothetical protein NDJ89_06825 [Oligoflexia bacterium]|nr:hypothetical protein [Oligoflexia bacterium]
MGAETLKKPALHFSARLPAPSRFGRSALLIHDRAISRHVPGFRRWARSFPASYAVDGGESLKSLDAFPGHMSRILSLADRLGARDLTIVVAGGGSVGDFGGFVASILKRGVKLVQIPSTWLSAIDSAHGGKTALNVGGMKNQIGTFYAAGEVHLVRELLEGQGEARVRDAMGELAKIALLEGGARWKRFAREPASGTKLLWRWLPPAIEAKYRVVARDPFERSGIRQILNLGHTLGHVLEAHYGLSHGEAVAQGLLFAVEWSRKKGTLAAAGYRESAALLYGKCAFRCRAGELRPLLRTRFLQLARGDKKRTSADRVTFIFLAGPGKPAPREVTLSEFANEARAQGWLGKARG